MKVSNEKIEFQGDKLVYRMFDEGTIFFTGYIIGINQG